MKITIEFDEDKVEELIVISKTKEKENEDKPAHKKVGKKIKRK